MTITFYYDPEADELYTEEEMLRRKDELIDSAKTDGYYCQKFLDWLNSHYEASDVFNLDSEDKEDIENEFFDYATEEVENNWELRIFEKEIL